MPSMGFGRRIHLFFSLMWISCCKCWQGLQCKNVSREVKDHFEILCLGLSQAGKTSLLSALVGEKVENIQPTTGFNTKNLILQDISINIKEIGGGESVRPFWNRYFNGIHGLIYVIDGSADEKLITVSCQELKNVFNAHPAMNTLPCLVLFTHQDSPDMRKADELTEMLKKSGLNNRNKKQWIMHPCSIFEPETVKDGIDSFLALLSARNQNRVMTDD